MNSMMAGVGGVIAMKLTEEVFHMEAANSAVSSRGVGFRVMKFPQLWLHFLPTQLSYSAQFGTMADSKGTSSVAAGSGHESMDTISKKIRFVPLGKLLYLRLTIHTNITNRE